MEGVVKYMIVRVPFFLAHRSKDPGSNTYCLVDWAWFTVAKWVVYKPSGAQSKESYNTYTLASKNICIEQQEKQQKKNNVIKKKKKTHND